MTGGSLVERATSDMLIGPDWAMYMEICDAVNHDPGLSKEVVRGIKKRIRSKSPKVQLLVLTLLETMIKNCSDIFHMHVAEKDIPYVMVKILKKKPDFHVKEKILVLIDTWQDAFGGPQGRYPQFYAAYQELLRAGAVFPKRRSSAPIFTPQNRPGLLKPAYQQEEPGSSVDSEFPVLSLAEIQKARGIVDVLGEMLNVLEPGNKEGLRQDIIADLIGQCRSYKQRVVNLVNSTSDEDLLCQGLALNDDLERVLAKRDAIATETTVPVEKSNSLQALVDIDDPAVSSTDSSTQPDQRSTTNASNQPPLQQLLLPAPPTSNGSATSSSQVDPFIDLLSGEGSSTPTDEKSLALVPGAEPHENSAREQNALVLSNTFSQNSNINNNNSLENSFDSHSVYSAQHADPATPQLQFQQQHPILYANGSIPNSGISQYEQAAYEQENQSNSANTAWNGHVAQGLNHHQQEFYGINDQGGSLPPPPWEIQPMQSSEPAGSQTQMQSDELGGGLYPQAMPGSQLGSMQPGMMQSSQVGSMHPGMMQSNQQMGIFPSTIQSGLQAGAVYSQSMHTGQIIGMHLQPMQGGQLTGYTYGQHPEAQFYDQRSAYPYASPDEVSQRMYGLSMRDNSTYTNTGHSYQMSNSSSYVHQAPKPSKPEDKLFGDLVTMARSKQK